MAINRKQISAPQPPGLPSNQQITGATPWISRPPVTIVTPSPFVTVPTAPQAPAKPPSAPPVKRPVSISFWFNAFIPNDLSWIPVVTQDGGRSRYLLIPGLPEAAPGSLMTFCIVNTNNRGFSSDRNAGRKTQIGGRIDLKKNTCSFDKPSTSPTTHLSVPPNMASRSWTSNLLSAPDMHTLAADLSRHPLLPSKAVSSPAYKGKPRFYTSPSGYILDCVAANRDPVAWNACFWWAKAAARIANPVVTGAVKSVAKLGTQIAGTMAVGNSLTQLLFRPIGNYMMPAIDMGMKLFFSKDLSRLTGYEITIDNFPAFEVYLQVDNNPPVVIFQKAPEPGTNPWSLMNTSIPKVPIANPLRVFKSQKVVQLWNP
jgi:hypothetical protein